MSKKLIKFFFSFLRIFLYKLHNTILNKNKIFTFVTKIKQLEVTSLFKKVKCFVLVVRYLRH